jgi:OOP family OmpA-OmpF porin
MYREDRLIRRSPDLEASVDRRYVEAMSNKFSPASTDTTPEYKAPAKGATPFATQRRAIYFDSGSANMSPDSRAIVDEIGGFMRSYENTVVDIEGNTDSTGSREINVNLSKARAEAVRGYLMKKFGFPGSRMRSIGNGPDKPIESNATTEGREKNRRTDIKVYANPGAN